ncbi:putative mannan synthase 11 isoform X2 [Canna indica]|uniref:glucomannan 4-beta-mannosyltransferase n=1 Tax=Canna indica TaxID=4628 RepID=A0AAQ3JZJ3_9LILI|nr:putative mannan synthase 11 isoform X2 [Canna indica]
MEEGNVFIARSCALLANSFSSLFDLTRCSAVAAVRAGGLTGGRDRRGMAGAAGVGGGAAYQGRRGGVLGDVADGAGGEGLDGAHKPLRQGLPPPAGEDLQVRPPGGGRREGHCGFSDGLGPDSDVQREGACNLVWPEDRIIIQVLDDSTDLEVKQLVKKECEMWHEKGKNIRYETRANRNGYKAGALKVGMTYAYVDTCEYIAMFDADFQPMSDFLIRTVPFLVHNPNIALVQARWKFVNASECLMTRTQEMSMDFHFKVEQESGSTAWAFFGYNGTAGVWRIKAIGDAGGWQDRTTVEDMDLAVRAGLSGWKFLYLGDVKVISELPSTFKAYRYQQHRWSCGPANLFRKLFWNVLLAKEVSIGMKFYVLYNFFIARRIVSHFVTFLFYCLLIPTSVFFPEVEIPSWGVIYVPTTITLLNSVGTPSSFHLVIFWVLFENVMALHRCKAVLIGLLEIGRVNEWVVTEKLGDMMKTKPDSTTSKLRFKFKDRFNLLEIVVAIYLFICACYDCKYSTDAYFIYIFPQSIAFFIMGIGYVGTIIPGGNS